MATVSRTITLADLTIEHGTSNWGGPVIRISLDNKLIEAASWHPEAVRVFELKHTKGIEGMGGRDKGHGWHVQDVTDGERGGHHWHGVLNMRAADKPDAAITEMLDYLNFLAERDRISDAMEGAISDLTDALRNFNESLEFRSHRDHNQEWPHFIAAVAAADGAYRAALLLTGGER